MLDQDGKQPLSRRIVNAPEILLAIAGVGEISRFLSARHFWHGPD